MTTAEHPIFSEKGGDRSYLWLGNADISSDDVTDVNELKEAVPSARAFSNRRFEFATNLVLFALLASVPGTQGVHLLHESDAFICHEDFSAVSAAAEGLFFSIGVNHHPRDALRTLDMFKDDDIIDKVSARSSLAASPSLAVISSLATAFATDESDKSRVAGTDSCLNFSTGGAKADHTTGIIGESGSMVRTIGDYTKAEFLFLIFIF